MKRIISIACTFMLVVSAMAQTELELKKKELEAAEAQLKAAQTSVETLKKSIEKLTPILHGKPVVLVH
jgi:predicted translin family RNA/ssDNA-binding protein